LGPRLEQAISGFEPLKGVQKLDPHISHLIRPRRELLGMPYGESDAIHGNTRLVCHLELDWRRLG
jgi:hypothetical protein